MRLPGAEFINGRMSLGGRLGLLSAVFCASIALLLALFVNESWKQIAFAKKEVDGVEYLAKVWPAFHRAAVGLRDDGQAAGDFEAVRGKYDARFGSSAAAQAFAQAPDQTKKLAAGKLLIDAICDASNLTLDPDVDSFYVMDAATVELPDAVEAVAALAEAAALPVTDPARPIRLAEALQTVRIANATAVESLETAMKANVSGETRKALGAGAALVKQTADAVLAQKAALIAGAGPETLVEARQALLAADDQTHRTAQDELRRLVEARISRLTGSMITNLSLVGVSLLLAAILAFAISGGLSGRISTLLGAMARLIQGDTAVEVPHLDDRNETGRIAETVAAFKQSLIDGAALREKTAEQEMRAEEQRRDGEADRARSAAEQAHVVESIGKGLEKLSAGVLVFRIAEEFAPHYEKLRADFNTAMEQLQGSMRIVAGNTAGVRSASGEISQASDDLSRRTEQQAASLEETAAALDEITATVRRTAEGAGSAREMVANAKADAERSSAVVGDAVSAMGEIEGSARQISQIIGVIDEIAFQTNLLALNAGVEAARAGDAGKGFAVVASEVRALAQRSAEAAKEIKTLISASSQQVDRGVSLVDETGKALVRIVAQVAEINTVVTEIAASAQEQATGLQQVNTAVNQMDQVTQQNAAMVEQSTAASHTLTGEAEQLSALIARFELGGETAHAPEARRAPPARSHAPVPAMRTTGPRGGAAPRPHAEADAEAGWDEF